MTAPSTPTAARFARAVLQVTSGAGALWGLANRFLGSKYAFHAVVVLLLLVPHCFSSDRSSAALHLGIPRVHSGDEPHYLVLINSLLADRDLDLANNYAAVHRGADDAGRDFAGRPLDHHSIWFVGDRRVNWFTLYEMDPPRWKLDAEGHPVPTLRPGVDPAAVPTRELPWNSPGLALVLAPLLYFAPHRSWVEPLALLCSWLAVALGTLFWRRLASALTADQRVVNGGLALAFLGTPAWHYGRSLFSEPYLIALVLGAYGFSMVRPRAWAAGLMMGVAIFIKPVVVLVGLPIGVHLLAQRRPWPVVQYAVPCLFGVGGMLAMNGWINGDPFLAPNAYSFGHPLWGPFNVLLDPSRGLLATAPIALVALTGWAALIRAAPRLIAPLAAIAVYFLATSLNRAWSGGWAYSIRFLVPVLPLMCLGLVQELQPQRLIGRWRGWIIVVAALSVLVNGLAAIQYWRVFGAHPFVAWIPNTEL